MKQKLLPLAALALVCIAGWYIGGKLSPDALGLALGVIFGMMAGIPAALIALSTRSDTSPSPSPVPQSPDSSRPPIIQLTGQPMQQVIEHRHVHVHVGADGKPINQNLLAPPSVQQAAQQSGGIPIKTPYGWNITDGNTGKVLVEMRRSPSNRQLEMKP